MASIHSTVARVHNRLAEGLNEKLIALGMIDVFIFGPYVQHEGKRACSTYLHGNGVYSAGWREGEDPVIAVVCDMILLDEDTTKIYKYADALTDFLNEQKDIGLMRLVTDMSISQKSVGETHNRVAVVYEIIIDTMEDDDE